MLPSVLRPKSIKPLQKQLETVAPTTPTLKKTFLLSVSLRISYFISDGHCKKREEIQTADFFIFVDSDCVQGFTRCWHSLKTVKNVMVAEYKLAFTRCRNNLKMVRDLTVRKCLQDFDAIKGTYTLSVNQSCSKSDEICSIFNIFKCLHDAISKMCRLEFNFQNRPFSKCAGKKCAVFM